MCPSSSHTIALCPLSMTFLGPVCARQAPSCASEFSSTRADARPSMSRNLDTSAAGVGVAKTSFWERLCTRSILRDRADRRRVRDEKKGSEACEDGPAEAGSSKSNVRGFGAVVDQSGLYIKVALQRTQIQNLRRRGTDDATLNSSIAAQADWEFCHWM